MQDIIIKIKDIFNDFNVVNGLEILVLAVIFYITMVFLKKNNAGFLNFIFVLLVLVGGVIVAFSSRISGATFLAIPFAFVLFVCITFSVEIKREIWNKDKVKISDYKSNAPDLDANTEECINEIVKALQNMSKSDTGALIILASSNVPNTILESGVILNAKISSPMIESVFFPKSPLHDGAMIIKDKQIQAAGCFLPLSQEINLPKELGTRHRAGIGITETIDVTSLIVSEETGIISVVKNGKILRYADSETLRKTLKEFYWQDYE